MAERARVALLIACGAALATASAAQQVAATPVSDSVRIDAVLSRVRRYTTSDVEMARTLADSLVTALPANSPAMPEALFTKAAIAPTAAAAERDYARIVNDYRFAPRVPDALMRLALLESARSNRVGALAHLDRLLRNHSDAPVRSRASLMAGRLRMDMNDPARACELLAAAYASAGPNDRDVKDQAETVGAKCPTPIAALAAREPAPMGILRAPRETATPATVATVKPGPPRRPSAPVRDTAVKPVVPVVAIPRPATPVRDTAVKPVVPVVAIPRPATPVRDTVAKPAPPVVSARPTTPVRDTVVKPATPASPKPTTSAPVTVESAAPTTPATRPPAPSPAPVVSPSTAVAESTARYAVQFAAYNDRPGAEKFADVLRNRGIIARVEGSSAPFRVRAGRFTTRAEAEASAALWRRPGQAAIVVDMGPAR